jgi:nitrogen fixation NifU-like protein
MYTKKVLKHFEKPKNQGVIENADGIGKVGNIICGDVMYLYIKVEQKNDEYLIKDIKFQTFGCTAAIATSSMITELAKGKSFPEALKLKGQKITEALKGLPPVKMHCSVLAYDAMVEAIYDFLTKNKKPIPAEVLQIHKRIEKERNVIEEKYKDWTDNQKKVFEKGNQKCGN